MDSPTPAPGFGDYALFGLALVAGLVVGLLGLAFTLVFVPLGLATFAMRRAKARRDSESLTPL